MKAVRYDKFEGPLRLVDVPDPTPTPDGVVVKVRASGLCRSDWHGWMGHSLRKRGRHIQVGLLLADQSDPPCR